MLIKGCISGAPMGRHAQFALEYLMTYGWALFILGVIIAALFSMGVVDINGLMPERCTFFGQAICKEFQLSPTQVKMIVGNDFGVDLVIKNVTLSDATNLKCTVFPTQVNWPRGAYIELNFTNCAGSQYVTNIRQDILVSMYFYRSSTCPLGTTPSCVYRSMGTIDGVVR
jgi:hypothetical protein